MHARAHIHTHTHASTHIHTLLVLLIRGEFLATHPQTLAAFRSIRGAPVAVAGSHDLHSSMSSVPTVAR